MLIEEGARNAGASNAALGSAPFSRCLRRTHPLSYSLQARPRAVSISSSWTPATVCATMAAAIAQELSKLSISGPSSLEALTAAASKGPAAEIHLISHLPAVLKATADKASARDAAGGCWARSQPLRSAAWASGPYDRPVQSGTGPRVVAAAMRWRVNSLPWRLGSAFVPGLFRGCRLYKRAWQSYGRPVAARPGVGGGAASPASCLARSAYLLSPTLPPFAGCCRSRRCRCCRPGHHVCAEPQRREAGAPCPV